MITLIVLVCLAVLAFAAFTTILPYILVVIGALALYFVGFHLIKLFKNRRTK